MTIMMRSQTNEQLAARWDKEPWVDPVTGERLADGAVPYDALFDFAPRPECIPSRDPLPYAEKHPSIMHSTERSSYARKGYVWAPHPAYARPPVNPILIMFRKSVADGDDDAFENAMSCAKGWPIHGHVTEEDRAFARKVLTRLAALAEI